MAYRPKYDYLNKEKELETEIEQHIEKGSIFTEKIIDKPLITLNFQRAENELKHAETIFAISQKDDLKLELNLIKEDTFYSGAISHAYYSIFYSTKALLLTVKMKTKSPNIHKATLDAFAYHFVINGKLDLELLKIYQSALIKADSLLGLFITEKDKRGEFTYQKLPDANKEPAKDSIDNATKFLTHVKKLIENKKGSMH
jgi:uncharacterized protein (UPF0332 family)